MGLFHRGFNKKNTKQIKSIEKEKEPCLDDINKFHFDIILNAFKESFLKCK